MNLTINVSLIENYNGNSQKARVLTKDWIANNVYCPICEKEKNFKV